MILGIIQARLGSSRLPGKALKEIVGKPMLLLQIERMQMSKYIERVVIATADTPENHPIIDFAEKYDVGCYAGSEDDLTDRIYQTAKQYGGDVIVRIGADCPLNDPFVIDKVIEHFQKGDYDYVSNTVNPTYPDGLDLQVVPLKTFERLWNELKDPFWREWASSYIQKHPDLFRIGSVEHDENLSHMRWTVDYEEDFFLVKRIFEELYSTDKAFGVNDIVGFLSQEPELALINEKYTRNEGFAEAINEVNK